MKLLKLSLRVLRCVAPTRDPRTHADRGGAAGGNDPPAAGWRASPPSPYTAAMTPRRVGQHLEGGDVPKVERERRINLSPLDVQSVRG
jgi:hypothetical protein